MAGVVANFLGRWTSSNESPNARAPPSETQSTDNSDPRTKPKETKANFTNHEATIINDYRGVDGVDKKTSSREQGYNEGSVAENRLQVAIVHNRGTSQQKFAGPSSHQEKQGLDGEKKAEETRKGNTDITLSLPSGGLKKGDKAVDEAKQGGKEKLQKNGDKQVTHQLESQEVENMRKSLQELKAAHQRELASAKNTYDQNLERLRNILKTTREENKELLEQRDEGIKKMVTKAEKAEKEWGKGKEVREVSSTKTQVTSKGEEFWRAQFQQSKEAHEHAMESLKSGHEQEILATERTLRDTQENYDSFRDRKADEIANIHAQHDKALQATAQTERKRVDKAWEKKVEELKEANSRNLLELKGVQAALDVKQKVEDSLRDQLKKLQEARNREDQSLNTKQIQVAVQEAVQRVNKAWEDKVAISSRDTEVTLSEIRKAEDLLRGQLQKSQDAHTHEVGSLRVGHHKEIQKLQRSYEKLKEDYASLHDRSKTMSSRHEHDIETVRQEEKQRVEKVWGDKIEEIKKTALYEKQTLQGELGKALKAGDVLKKGLQEAHVQELETLTSGHSQKIQDIQNSLENARRDHASLLVRMNNQTQDATTVKQQVQDAQIAHRNEVQKVEAWKQQYNKMMETNTREVNEMRTQLESTQVEKRRAEEFWKQKYDQMKEKNSGEIQDIRTKLENTRAVLEEERRVEGSWKQKYEKMEETNSRGLNDIRTELESTQVLLEESRGAEESWKQKYEGLKDTKSREVQDIRTKLESTQTLLKEKLKEENSWKDKLQGTRDAHADEINSLNARLANSEQSWKDKLQETRNAHADEINSLNTRLAKSEQSWKDQLRDHQDAHAKAEESWRIKLRDSQETYTREVNSLNARYAEAEKSWSDRLRDSEKTYNHDMDSLNSRYTILENQLRDSQQAHARDVDTVNTHHVKVKDQLREAQEAHARDVDSFNARYAKVKDQLRVSQETHASEMDSLNTRHTKAIGQLHNLQEAHSREIDSLDALHAKDKKSFEKQLQDSQEAHSRELASLKAQSRRDQSRDPHGAHAREIDSLNAHYKKAKESWENQFRDSQESHAREIDSLNTRYTKARDQLRDAQEAHTRDMDSLNARHTNAKKQLQDIQEAHAREIDSLDALYAKAQDQLRSSQEAHAHELNSLDARYAKDKETLNNQLQGSVTRDALNDYRAKVESWKDQLQNSHAQEIKGIREGAKKEYDALHDRMTRQIQDINVQHDQNIQLVRQEEEERVEKIWEKKLEKAKEKSSRDVAVATVGRTASPNRTTKADGYWETRFHESQVTHAHELESLNAAKRSVEEDFASLRKEVQLDDSPEPSEVCSQFMSVRALIEDLCSDLSERWSEISPKAKQSTLKMRKPQRITTINFGPPISLLNLSSSKGRELGDIVDCALPTIASSLIDKLIFSPFHPMLDRADSDAVFKIYQKLRRNESQIAAGRWRKQVYESLESQSSEKSVDDLMKSIATCIEESWAKLFTLVDDKSPSNMLQSKDRDTLIEAVKAAWEWNKMIKCKAISSDFHPIIFKHDAPFDDAGMEIPKRVKKPARITCTLLPGLQVSEAVGGASPTFEWLEKAEIDF